MSRLRRLLRQEILAQTILVHGKDQPVGDAFIQSGFFHALRCCYPNARITFAVSMGGSAYSGGLAHVMAPFIDEVLTHQALSLDWRALDPRKPRPLAPRRFDLIIDLEKCWWQTLILRRTRTRCFVSASRHFLFSDCWPRTWQKPPHLSAQYLMLLDALGTPQKADLPPPNFRDPAREAHAEALLPLGPRYVGLVLGAGDRGKCWPLERYLALARALQAEGLTPVFLLGPAESDLVPQVLAAFDNALLPAWELGEDGARAFHPAFASPLMTVALGRQLCAAVTNDCGMAHMLAAANTPLLTVFGYTNPKKYLPLSTVSEAISARHYGSISPAVIPVEDVLPKVRQLVMNHS